MPGGNEKLSVDELIGQFRVYIKMLLGIPNLRFVVTLLPKMNTDGLSLKVSLITRSNNFI